MQVSKVSTHITFPAYCACTSYELITKWRIFLLTSLTKRLWLQVHFTVKSASAYISTHGHNEPLYYKDYGTGVVTYDRVCIGVKKNPD